MASWEQTLHKTQHFQIPIRSGGQVFTHEPLAREIRRLLPQYDVIFDLPFFLDVCVGDGRANPLCKI